MPEVRKPTKVVWHEVAKVGYPPADLCVCVDALDTAPRKFLVRNDYDMECAYPFERSSGFDTSDRFHGEVTAWAVIDGF